MSSSRWRLRHAPTDWITRWCAAWVARASWPRCWRRRSGRTSSTSWTAPIPTRSGRTRGVDVKAAKALGVAIADRAMAGRDKLLVAPPPQVDWLAHWVEQLVAESSGKDGRGVIPIVHDPVRAALPDMQSVGPQEISSDPLDLGIGFLRWSSATQALDERPGVNAFDQPDVDEAKRLARAELTGAQQSDPLPTLSLETLRRSARPGDDVANLE